MSQAAGLSLGFRTAEDFDEGPLDPEPQPGGISCPPAWRTESGLPDARACALCVRSPESCTQATSGGWGICMTHRRGTRMI